MPDSDSSGGTPPRRLDYHHDPPCRDSGYLGRPRWPSGENQSAFAERTVAGLVGALAHLLNQTALPFQDNR